MVKTNKKKDKPYEVDYEGTKHWYKNGKLHREDGPAVEWTNGDKAWYKNGKLHREDGPAVECEDGTKRWYKNGELHRDDGPAEELSNSDKSWYNQGRLHREDGPAVEGVNGTKAWYKNGKLHRDDGPAVEYANGTKYWFQNGKSCKPSALKQMAKTNKKKYKPCEIDTDGTKRWYKNGKLHRDDGPAVEFANGDKGWYRNGQFHRDDGPAIEWTNGTKYWYQHGQYHREDGPAIELADGTKKWFQNGKICEPLALKQMVKTNKKKLFRVDATLSYLVVTEKDIYTVKDFLAWAKNDMHSGELDESSALEIKEVKSTEQIQDYLDRDFDYMAYDNTNSTDVQYLSSLINELGLDSDVIAARLRELGYTVIPPTTKRTVKKTKQKKGGAE